MADKHTLELARKLYRTMPGAPPVPTYDGGKPMWGEVEDNEHFGFCLAVTELALNAAQAYSR